MKKTPKRKRKQNFTLTVTWTVESGAKKTKRIPIWRERAKSKYMSVVL